MTQYWIAAFNQPRAVNKLSWEITFNRNMRKSLHNDLNNDYELDGMACFPFWRRESIFITYVKIDHLIQLRADGQPAPAIGGTDYTSQSFHICWYMCPRDILCLLECLILFTCILKFEFTLSGPVPHSASRKIIKSIYTAPAAAEE